MGSPIPMAWRRSRRGRFATWSGPCPGLVPEPVQSRHCWITELPWANDGFALWKADAAAFLAGHNLFKHAPALGAALAADALGEAPDIDLSEAARLGSP